MCLFAVYFKPKFSISMAVAIDLILIFQSFGNILFFLSVFEGITCAELTCPVIMHLSLETPISPPPHPGETWGIRQLKGKMEEKTPS